MQHQQQSMADTKSAATPPASIEEKETFASNTSVPPTSVRKRKALASASDATIGEAMSDLGSLAELLLTVFTLVIELFGD